MMKPVLKHAIVFFALLILILSFFPTVILADVGTATESGEQLPEAGSSMAPIMFFLGISLLSFGLYFKKAQIFLTN